MSYTNRMGKTYFLHEGRTNKGKPRYFVARTVGEGALSTMPSGYELTESINGVVSVRKVDTSAPAIPKVDLEMARAEMARHPHLRLHRIEEVKGEIVVFEPAGGLSLDDISELSPFFGLIPDRLAARLESRQSRYHPVMKFVPDEEPGHYTLLRMTYRGDGGWSWPLATGSLRKLVQKYLGRVGTEKFFELL